MSTINRGIGIRELTTHKVNGLNDALYVASIDHPGSGGAHHEYEICLDWRLMPRNPEAEYLRDETIPDRHDIRFQKGPVAEAGVNGISHEALLAILIDRLECFQAGPYACQENGEALAHLRSALDRLIARTMERIERQVEGTSTP